MRRLLSFFFLLLGIAGAAQNRNYPFIHYTTENGLPSNSIYLTYRDSKGFMWVGTEKGIARYNGIRFENYSTFDGLPDNEVLFFQEDRQRRLWLGTFNGKLCYYKNNVFHTDANTPFLNVAGIPQSYTKNIIVEKDGTVTILFAITYVFLNIDGEKIKLLDFSQIPEVKRMGMFNYVRKLSANAYIVAGSLGNAIIDTNKHVLHFWLQNNWHINLGQNQNQIFFFQSNFADRRFMYNDDTLLFSAQPRLRNNQILNIYCADSQIYLISREGLYLYDSVLIFDAKVSSLNQDVRGNYWVGTANDGIYCLSKNFLNTRLFKNVYTDPVLYTFTSHNKLFFSTAEALYALSENQQHLLIKYSDRLPGLTGFKPLGGILEDRGKYYYFIEEHNLVLDNLGGDKISIDNYSVSDSVSPGNYKKLLAVGNEIYFQYPTGISYIDYSLAAGHKMKAIPVSMGMDRVYCMAVEGDSVLWFSRGRGLFKFSNHVQQKQSQFNGIVFKNFIFFNNKLIGYTHDNKLLICSNYNGQVVVDTIQQQQNCVWNAFYRLDNNHLLIGTNDLYRVLTIAPKEKSFSLSVIENPFLPLHAEAICLDSSNCYFFKDGSVTTTGIHDILASPPAPVLFFASLKTTARTYNTNENIKIPYSESKNINISFSTNAFGGKNVFYQYSISNDRQHTWQNLKGEEIELIHPRYGRYTVTIRARTLSSDFGTPLVLRFTILRPVWARWWFVSLMMLVVLAIVSVIVRSRILIAMRKKEQQHQTEIKFIKSEYKTLNALMNPHFIFNTLNNLQSLYIEDDKQTANEYLRIFADLIRQNMHNVSKELITLQKEIDLVKNYLLLEKLRFEDKLNYSIQIDDDLDLSEIMVPPLLIQPIVENSIKHGIQPRRHIKGQVIVSIFEREDVLYIEVKDNGIGINKNKGDEIAAHESFGLENIKKRIEQLGIILNKKIALSITEIADQNGNCEWTVVTITLPI